MWFRRSSDQLLNEPKRLSTADYLCKLMEEQNSLLRELLRAQGRMPATIRATPVGVSRIRTDKDVSFVGRTTSVDEQKANGRDSAPTGSTSGSTPNGPVDAPAGLSHKPSAL